jgi:hypothetical protein
MYHINSCTACGRPKQGQPGSWCPCPSHHDPHCHGGCNLNCTSFVFDATHLKAAPLSPSVCASVPAGAPVYCLGEGSDLWAALPCPSPCTLPPPPPSPPPPPPPPPSVPAVWHLPARCEEGDVNALFQYRGRWHLMQQWHARPATSVGHAVSTDLLRWWRVADVLSSGAAQDQQCYDGSASLVRSPTTGQTRPVLMIDGGCGEKGPGTARCMESAGNGSTGGVTAIPLDLSDLNLTRWQRRGPTVFRGCNGASGPSPILSNPVTGKHQLIAIYGRGEALFEATAADLTAWQIKDTAFLPSRGGGGGLWHELPLGIDGSPASVHTNFTHIMQLNGAHGGDGAATFAAMRVDPATSKVTDLGPTTAVDIGDVRYGQLSSSGATAADGRKGDPRTVHVSWFVSAGWAAQRCVPSDIQVGQLTCFRDLRFDHRVGPAGALVEMPIDEYKTLRGGVLGRVAAQPLTQSTAVLMALPAGPSAADIEMNFTAGAIASILSHAVYRSVK